jgi:hypothetical protein
MRLASGLQGQLNSIPEPFVAVPLKQAFWACKASPIVEFDLFNALWLYVLSLEPAQLFSSSI